MSNLIRIQGLTRRYKDGTRDVPVLENVSLNLDEGDMLAIVGSSGSGKSTLLHLIGGLDTADAGSVHIGNTEVTALKGSKLAQWRNRELGFVYQFHHLLGEFSALENVALPLLIAGDPAHKAKARAKEILQKVGLAHRLEHAPSQLSGGERQRVAIARALVNNPRLVLADEPTGNLDEQTAEQVYDLMTELNRSLGTAFIVVTHDHELAARLPRQLQLHLGQLVSGDSTSVQAPEAGA